MIQPEPWTYVVVYELWPNNGQILTDCCPKKIDIYSIYETWVQVLTHNSPLKTYIRYQVENYSQFLMIKMCGVSGLKNYTIRYRIKRAFHLSQSEIILIFIFPPSPFPLNVYVHPLTVKIAHKKIVMRPESLSGYPLDRNYVCAKGLFDPDR